MSKKDTSGKPTTEAQMREDRLKQALKANLARRKAQTRARNEEQPGKEQDKG